MEKIKKAGNEKIIIFTKVEISTKTSSEKELYIEFTEFYVKLTTQNDVLRQEFVF